MAPRRTHPGFALIELLVVIGILTLLMALLLPVFVLAKRKSNDSECVCNLKQIGQAVLMYTQDYAGYPYASDPLWYYRYTLGARDFSEYPEFQEALGSLPWFHHLLQPYTASRLVFHCPLDQGQLPGCFLIGRNYFEEWGTSYLYNAFLPLLYPTEAAVEEPAKEYLSRDGCFWHLGYPVRIKTVYLDYHVKGSRF